MFNKLKLGNGNGPRYNKSINIQILLRYHIVKEKSIF